jgi:hypothetical protein
MWSRDEQLEENITLNTEIKIIQTLTELEHIYDLKAKGEQLRSSEKWIELHGVYS